MSKDKPKYTQMEAYKELYHAVIDLVLTPGRIHCF